MLTLLQAQLVDKKKWINNDELAEMTAIAESTPGPIAINLATYLGYKRLGFFGAFTATLAVVITPFTLMFFISMFLENALSVNAISYAFIGIKVGVVFLLLRVSYTLIKTTKKDLGGILLLITTLTIFVTFTVFSIVFSAIYFILIGAGIGLLIYGVIPKKKLEKKESKK